MIQVSAYPHIATLKYRVPVHEMLVAFVLVQNLALVGLIPNTSR